MAVDPNNPQFLEWLVDRFFLRPATWIREHVVEPNRPKHYWYHRKYPRVPEIDECYMDDFPCQFEANQQFKRDMNVESEILRILRRRYEDCVVHEAPDSRERCAKVRNDYNESEVNWFIKYGDLGWRVNARDAYLKQKHRLVFERRKLEKEAREAQEQQFAF